MGYLRKQVLILPHPFRFLALDSCKHLFQTGPGRATEIQPQLRLQEREQEHVAPNIVMTLGTGINHCSQLSFFDGGRGTE